VVVSVIKRNVASIHSCARDCANTGNLVFAICFLDKYRGKRCQRYEVKLASGLEPVNQ
jgi:hypothetical protein